MAVFQDIPPELLYRILELLHGVWIDKDEYSSRRPWLAACALVARDWRAPSQALLYKMSNVDSERRGVELLHHLERHPHLSPRQLVVEGIFDETSLGRLLKLCASLKSLNLWLDGPELNTETLNDTLSSTLEELKLNSPVRGSLSVPVGIPLRCLPLYNKAGLSVAFLESFCRSATNLTCLTLDADFPNPEPFLAIAFQITKLELWQLDESPPTVLDFITNSLVPACTRLVVLEIWYAESATARPLITSCRCGLKALLLNLDDEVGGWDEMRRILDLPALAELKRWRLGMDPDRTGLSLDPAEATVRTRWFARCAQRGIEVRGDELYFTD